MGKFAKFARSGEGKGQRLAAKVRKPGSGPAVKMAKKVRMGGSPARPMEAGPQAMENAAGAGGMQGGQSPQPKAQKPPTVQTASNVYADANTVKAQTTPTTPSKVYDDGKAAAPKPQTPPTVHTDSRGNPKG